MGAGNSKRIEDGGHDGGAVGARRAVAGGAELGA
jgi:hypothetical protein